MMVLSSPLSLVHCVQQSLLFIFICPPHPSLRLQHGSSWSNPVIAGKLKRGSAHQEIGNRDSRSYTQGGERLLATEDQIHAGNNSSSTTP